ncbi:hypothetical protein CQW23_25041 [Capsicum baccatum]|uniref:NAC domain-containing protein n=1 Tax=Capsicum baccatum TaxID=33114 RepID=A0A2G2VWK2_CAPBA|nr:hypothetical protein CQW23_25041 [Capsicum baccatum]
MAMGIRFHPRDEELIRYLLKFVSCKNYSCHNIQFEDLYGNKKPWEIFESNSTRGDEDAKKVKYFFTKLKKKKADGRRFIWTVIGGGSWKGLDGEKSIYDGPKIVGSKKNYRYQYKGYQADDVVWTMRENSLDEKILKALRRRSLMHYEYVVLCCVKHKINVHARDHKELRDCMPIEITSGDEVVVAMDATFQTAQQHDSCVLNRFTSSSEHNNVFHELQQDQNSEQLINQVQNIEDMAPFAQNHNGYVESYIEQGTTNFQDSCPVYPSTLSEHNAFQLQQDQNCEQVNVVQENNIEETTSFAQYHNDDVTCYSVEGATNFKDYNVDCYTYTGADFSSTLADLLNDIGTQPQLPIGINVHARDHKELGDYTLMEIPSGDEVVAAMDARLLTTQQYDSCLLNPFTSSEHNNVFHELQQDQSSSGGNKRCSFTSPLYVYNGSLAKTLLRNYILSGLQDDLYNVYSGTKTSKERWGALERKYKMEDAGIKKFLFARFLDFKMIDSKSVVSQVQELQVIIQDLLAEGLIVNDAFQEMTVEDLIVRLRIEEDNKAAERRSKENSTMNGAHIVEDGQNKSKKRKKVEHGSTQPKKKFKEKCFNCGKIGQKSTDCRASKKGKKKGQKNMIESNKEYDDLCAMFMECNLVGNPYEWWMDSGATRHICANKELFSSFSSSRRNALHGQLRYC